MQKIITKVMTKLILRFGLTITQQYTLVRLILTILRSGLRHIKEIGSNIMTVFGNSSLQRYGQKVMIKTIVETGKKIG